MHLFLIRHPRPRIAAGICYGRLDIETDDAQAIAAHLKPLLPEGIPVISSPLRRARQLAEALVPAPIIDARLSEIDFGTWEGRPWDEIERDALDAWADDLLGFTPPGGESVASLQRRAIDFAQAITAQALPQVALVTHAGILRALLGYWRQLPTIEWTQLNFAFGSLTHIEIEQHD